MNDTVASEIDIDGTVDEVLAVLQDFENYPSWARSMKSAKMVERGSDGRPLKVEFHVAPALLPEVTYILRYAYTDDGLSWTYDSGDLRDCWGSYVVARSGETTHVVYHLAIDPGPIALPGFVKAKAAREITRIALKELKRRVEAATKTP